MGKNRDDGAAPTAELIALHASRRPGDVAVIENGREISYREMSEDLGRMVAAVRAFELQPGRSAGIEFSRPDDEFPYRYLNWLAVLAFEATGVITLSFVSDEAATLKDTLSDLDLILCAPGGEISGAKRTRHMDRAWVRSVLERPVEDPIPSASSGPETPLRIVTSSGTTGAPKQMLYTRGLFGFVLAQAQRRIGFSRHSRYFVAMGFNIQSYQFHATACLRAGGTCIFESRLGFADALARYAVTHVTLMPHALMQVLDGLPGDYVKAPDLTVMTIGAAVSAAVRTRVKSVLAHDLVETYATNETNTVAVVGADGLARVAPGVQVEVIDDEGEPVLGREGLMRIKSPGCVSGYLGDANATARMFRGGWFYPGDLAVMEASGTLRLLGRADDQLNIRGLKYAPQALEERLIRVLPVDDLCLTTLADAAGVEQVVAVLVASGSESDAEIWQHLQPLLPSVFGSCAVVRVPEIPRTGTGKVRRKVLDQQLRTAQADVRW